MLITEPIPAAGFSAAGFLTTIAALLIIKSSTISLTAGSTRTAASTTFAAGT
jgi:hypothetical protein